MEKTISNYLSKRKCDPKQRVDRDNGGQFLDKFLKEFAEHIREEVLIEAQHTIKKLRKL